MKTMAAFKEILAQVKETGDPFDIVDLLDTIELRLRRVENHLGIPAPGDLLRVRKIEDRSKTNDQ